MKTKSSLRRKSARIKAARWSAYATAGAATALGSAISAEGNTITYSGVLNRHFGFIGGGGGFVISHFPLDQPGDVLVVERNSIGFTQPAGAGFVGLQPTVVSGAIAGFQGYNFIASKLAFGENISAQHFGFYFGDLGRYSGASETMPIPWAQPGTGFVGFRFDGGAGKQYGWVRITMEEGTPAYTFTLVDYAFADPGQRIRAGETGVPDSDGSLGLLAIGCAGLLAWRARRSNAEKSGV
jgi:hypothetical protein